MDLDKIKQLIDAMATSDLAELEVSENGWTLRLTRNARLPDLAPGRLERSTSTASSPQRRFAAISGNGPTLQNESTTDVSAPLSGVVYFRPAPDKPPFVEVGQIIKAGTTVCVIEAMKVFNEDRAERDGAIEAILAEAGQEVEAGQLPVLLSRSPTAGPA